ncbi:MAG TPA: dTDP-4-dehydrorhamnose reductase [Victivallales bacterium]|nr:dTDP-4-dehydrorhamnose reductase [Victivallales bacterium]HRR28593.1 dTDP-4-dehydrorhamnose reductase [Victivallales bacterium]
MKKIVIIGANGMLGTDFSSIAKEEGFTVDKFDLPDSDIRNEKDVKLAVKNADIVANFAAYTNVDMAESEKEICWQINAEAPAILAKECSIKNKFLLHTSTDFVFGDISSLPLKENDKTNPLNFYGKSKLEGEKNILKFHPNSLIVRLEWTYGNKKQNFITKIIDKAKNQKKIKVVADQYGSPTWTIDASYAMIDLLKKRTNGIFHYAADGYVNRFELAKFVINFLKIPVEIEPCSSTDIKTPAKRPLNSRFDCSKIDSILSFKRPKWNLSLKKYLSDLKHRDKI